MRHLTPLLTLSLSATALLASPADTPPEFGLIQWGRKLEPALASSASTGKPVWLQFQEAPG